MSQRDWNDYGAVTGPLIVTLILILLAFAPVLDSKMWQTIKDIISVVTPAAAVTVAAYAYKISRQQAATSEKQLKIGRFETRYRIYVAVMDLIAARLSRTIKMNDVYEYRASTKSAEFLFNQTIAGYVKRLQDCAIDLSAELQISRAWEQRGKIGELMESEERYKQENDLKCQQLCNWFDKQYDQANKEFFPYLSIE